jgi:hypothetical protein
MRTTPGHALLPVPVAALLPVARPFYCRCESLRRDGCTPDVN